MTKKTFGDVGISINGRKLVGSSVAEWSVTPRRFRPQRRTLAEALEGAVEVASKAELVAHLIADHPSWWQPVPNYADIAIEPYGGDDTRCDPVWRDTHIVTLPGAGVLGFVEGSLR